MMHESNTPAVSVGGSPRFSHFGSRPIERIDDRRTSQSTWHKPCGLWFGVDGSWRNFVERENMGVHFSLACETVLEVNLDRICVLDSIEALDAFSARFAVKRCADIDWEAVAEVYGGVLMLVPNVPDYEWTMTWDVKSGCLWDPSAGTLGASTQQSLVHECNTPRKTRRPLRRRNRAA